MAEVKKDLFYTESHEWVKVEGNIATVGISDFAQDQLGDIVYAEAVEEDTEVAVEDPVGSVESVKMASDIYAPVAGKIIAANVELEDEPEVINDEPFESWFVKIEMSDPADLDKLLNADDYEKFIEGE
ncbi:MAG: glycine cleavage system protein GcvH [Clostridiaceae bacterium]|nr:glycine cleavage system protein GcvH [Clostridiaceae bacterium]HZW98339.1 glycine cleavage system protein GcvH [Bacillota bacterium]